LSERLRLLAPMKNFTVQLVAASIFG
jgi:hypothetical protein